MKSMAFNCSRGVIPSVAIIGILACLAYSICSMSMTLVNKAIFSAYKFQYPLCVLLFQHVFTVGLLKIAKSAGQIDFPELNWPTVKIWYPVNLIFIAMLISGSYALKWLSVPMVTIFKNVTTTLITLGDHAFFGNRISSGIAQSLSLMIFGSIVGGYSDLSFNGTGYAWMGINIVVSASYALYMRHAMKKTNLNEWGMTYYNNLLSIPTLIPLIQLTGEFPSIFEPSTQEYDSSFYIVVMLSGIIGFAISLSSFWAINATSPTTYSIVGALNKIPLTILGFLLFKAPVSLPGAISITIALSGGLLYSWTKQKEMMEKQSKSTPSVIQQQKEGEDSPV